MYLIPAHGRRPFRHSGGRSSGSLSTRLRRTGLASAGALSLVLAASGLAAASHFTLATRPVAETQDPAVDPVVDPAPVVDTTATWEDIDGNGIDDDCQTTPAVDDPTAAAAADLAADLNGDGVLSQSEAAQSARTGGKNCNHGGYVSAMAHAKHDCTTPPPVEPTTGETTDPTTPTDATLTLATDDEQGEDANDNEQGEDQQGEDAEDQGDSAESGDDAEDQGDEAKDGSGDSAACDADTKVSDHQAAKDARLAAHNAAKAEREAKKAEAKAARDAAKAERKASTAAAHAKHANKGKSHSH